MVHQIDENLTVRELAGRHPQSRPIFERFGIDYCCGGEKSLGVAAHEGGIDFNALQAALEDGFESESPVAAIGTPRRLRS